MTDATRAYLDEIEELIPALFHVWADGSEHRLARYLWTVANDGAPADDGYSGRTRSVIHLAVLAALNLEFAAHSGEGTAGEWRDLVSDVVSESPRLTPLAVGRLAEAYRVDGWEDHDGDESVASVVVSLVEAVAPAVAEMLRGRLGDTLLFASFWAARTDVTFPLSNGQVDEIVASPTSDMTAAFEWVSSGMRL